MTNENQNWRAGSKSTSEEWHAAARSVGISGPGAMQQAKHMADAACKALGLEYADTAPVDIVDGVKLRCGREPSGCDATHDFAEEAQSHVASAESRLAEATALLDTAAFILERLVQHVPSSNDIAQAALQWLTDYAKGTAAQTPEAKP